MGLKTFWINLYQRLANGSALRRLARSEIHRPEGDGSVGLWKVIKKFC